MFDALFLKAKKKNVIEELSITDSAFNDVRTAMCKPNHNRSGILEPSHTNVLVCIMLNKIPAPNIYLARAKTVRHS